MTWTVRVVQDGNSHRVAIEWSDWNADRILVSTEANRLANQLLIAGAEAAKLNNPPKRAF